MKLTDILQEGRYDGLVGKINKKIFQAIKNITKNSGTEENPKPYKGRDIRQDPITDLDDLFEEMRPFSLGSFSNGSIGLDVLFRFIITNELIPGTLYVDGSSDDELDEIEINVGIHTSDAYGNKILSKLQPMLRDVVRHEIEHLTHGTTSLMISKRKRSDTAQRVKSYTSPDQYYKYYLLPKEIDANIHGLYAKAKSMKKPYQSVVDSELDALVDDGTISPQNRKKIYNAWKKRIPQIGGIPELR